MSVLPKFIYRFKTIKIKVSACYFCDYRQIDSQVYKRSKRPKIANAIMKWKNQTGGLILSDFKTYYKATVKNQCGTGKRTDK